MKKTFIILLLWISMASMVSAQTSDDVYVRKDVFDVYMQNINTNMERILNKLDNLEKSVNENTAMLSNLSARIDGVNTSLSAQIGSVNTRVDDLRNGLYLWLVVIGTFIAWPKAKSFIQTRSANKKYLTLEEVERLIDAHLKSKMQS